MLHLGSWTLNLGKHDSSTLTYLEYHFKVHFSVIQVFQSGYGGGYDLGTQTSETFVYDTLSGVSLTYLAGDQARYGCQYRPYMSEMCFIGMYILKG